MTSSGEQQSGIADDATTVIRRAPEVIATAVADGKLIVDVGSDRFIELNRSAALIWDLLDQPRTLSDLCALLLNRYDVSAELCRAQVVEWMDDMQRVGLIVVERD